MKPTSDPLLQTARQHAKQIHAPAQLEPQIVHLLLWLQKVEEEDEQKEEEARALYVNYIKRTT